MLSKYVKIEKLRSKNHAFREEGLHVFLRNGQSEILLVIDISQATYSVYV